MLLFLVYLVPTLGHHSPYGPSLVGCESCISPNVVSVHNSVALCHIMLAIQHNYSK